MNLGPYELDQVHQGYIPGALRHMPECSVHCVITSPPYWGLRVYDDVEPQDWADGSRCCLGLEETPEAYLEHMLECFRAVHRVLRYDGTLWLNMGDSYITNAHGYGDTHDPKWPNARDRKVDRCPNRQFNHGLKHKDLVGMPWRVALALQADGWYLRSDIIWQKPSPMPESANDRPTKSHEYVFLLSKSEKYFYDAFAIREPSSQNSHPRGNGVNPKAKEPAGWDTGPGGHHGKEGQFPSSKSKEIERAFNRKRKTEPRRKQNESFSSAVSEVLPFRNRRTVWRIASSPCKAAHFATFPPKLIIPMIKAGTSEKGVCFACGAPFARIIRKTPPPREDVAGTKYSGAEERVAGGRIRESTKGARAAGGDHDNPFDQPEHLGWEPTCGCQLFRDFDPGPAIVLDPFAGSGTTIAVAKGLGRQALGFDASGEYVRTIVPERKKSIASKPSIFEE